MIVMSVAIVVMIIAAAIIMSIVAMTITIVTTIAIPMVAVTLVVAFTNDLLIMATPVTYISCPYISMMFPWVALVNNHFVAMVQVVIMVSWRQRAGMYPYVVLIIN